MLMVDPETTDSPELRVTLVCPVHPRLESRETWVFRDSLDPPDDPENGEILERMV